MALLGAVLELKWFALKAFADVTVRPHPRQCLQYQSQALVAELQPRRICFLVGPPGGIACALRADTHKISWPGMRWCENRFPSLSASSRRTCFSSPRFSGRNSDVRKSGALSGCAVNGPRFA